MRSHDLLLPVLIVGALVVGFAHRAGRAQPPAVPITLIGTATPVRPPASPTRQVAVPLPSIAPPGAGNPPRPASVVLAEVHAAGAPIFSPDGSWLAVREADGDLALIAVQAALANPGLAPKRYPLAPPDPVAIGGQREIGSPACFSCDSSQLLMRAPTGLVVLTLPPAAAPVPLIDRQGRPRDASCIPAFAQAPPPRGTWPLVARLRAAQRDAQGFPVMATMQLLEDPQDQASSQPSQPSQPSQQTVPPCALRAEAPLSLSADGREIYGTEEGGDALAFDARSGRLIRRIGLGGLAHAAHGALGNARILAHLSDGTDLIEGQRPYPEQMRNMLGTYVPGGDDAPERGRNPGDAEPGPEMPRVWLRLSPGPVPAGQPVAGEPAVRIDRWWHAATARWFDSILLSPSRDLGRGLLLQIANDGGAGEGVPHLWLGTLDRAGTRTEHDLADPFPASLQAAVATLLDVDADAQSALVLVIGHRNALITPPHDPAAQAEAQRLMASNQAASVNGQAGVAQMVEQMQAFQRYHRMGSFDGAHLILPFAEWQVWLAEPGPGRFTAITPLFGETGAPDAGAEAGMPGAPAGWTGAPQAACCARTGLLALTLATPESDPVSPGKPQARGLQLIPLVSLPATISDHAQPRH